MMPAILGSGTAVPQTVIRQQDVLEQLIEPLFGHDGKTRRIFMGCGVETRYTVLPDLRYHMTRRTTAERNALYEEHAASLAETAARRCLSDASCEPADVDELITVTCTGVATPGPDLWLAARLGLSAGTRRTHIGAMGCYASLPAIHRASTAIQADPRRKVLVVAVELCTLHFQRDPSVENMVISSLFGDGAGAVLIGAPRDHVDGPQYILSATTTEPGAIDAMGFQLTDEGFRMRLSPMVPEILERLVDGGVARLLEPAKLRRDDVGFWLVHPGGVRILEATARGLRLPPDALSISRATLAAFGNLSSATSLFLLDAYRKAGRPHRGRPGVLLAFGPGLTLEGVLLEG